MRKLIQFVFFLAVAAAALGQSTNVAATLTDSDSVTWTLGSCTTTLIYKQQSPIVAPYLNSGGNVPLNPTCTVNGSGQLSATLTDVKFIAPIFQATWQFVVCPNVGPNAACGTTIIPVTGANENVSSMLNLPAPRVGGGIGATAYSDLEVSPVVNNTYWQVPANSCRTYTSGWGACGNGSAGTTNFSLTANNSGAGAVSGTAFNGSAPITISTNTIGAATVNAAVTLGTTAVPLGTTASSIAGFTSLGTSSLVMPGSTSGQATFVTQPAAGTPTITVGTASGTIAVTGAAPIGVNTTSGAIFISNMPLTDLNNQAANTIVGNATGSGAPPTALAVPNCNTGGISALIYTAGTGFGCNTISAVTSVNTNTGALVLSFNTGAGSCSYSGGTTTCTITGSSTGSGSVTNFIANSGGWPTWLVPTVATSTTTPTLSVAASAIPNAALANAATTVNGQTCTLGSTCTITASSGISGLTATYIPLAGSATTLTGNSALSDNGTTVSSSEPVSVPSLVVRGSSSGSSTLSESATGSVLNLGSTNATVDSAGNLIVAGCTNCGITGITSGDATPVNGPGAIALNIRSINGGTLFSAQGSGPECNTTGTGQLANCTNLASPGYVQAATYSRSGVYNVPCTNTPVFDLSQGNVQVLTLTTGCTAVTSSSVINTPTSGSQDVMFIVQQDATGNHPFPNPTWASTWTPVSLLPNDFTPTRLTFTSAGNFADNSNSQFCALSGTSPLACGNARTGFIVVPAGTDQTMTVNTTALTATAGVLFANDFSIGSAVTPTVTCGTSTIANPVLNARVNGTSFTVQVPGTTSGNVCLFYAVGSR